MNLGEEGKQKRVKITRSSGENKTSSNGLIIARACRPLGLYSQKQWMNCPTYLTYTYNPSVTP